MQKKYYAIGEKYDTPSLVHTMQLDPNIRTVTNFKQEYTVIIRKKKYYAINALEDENSYIRMYQVDNFTSLSTDIDCNNAGSGSCSVTIVGNTRIISLPSHELGRWLLHQYKIRH